MSNSQRSHSFREYSEWRDLQPYFLGHIEDAVGRMVVSYFELVKSREARADDDLLAKRAASRIRRLGFPPAESAQEAKLWAASLSESASYFAI